MFDSSRPGTTESAIKYHADSPCVNSEEAFNPFFHPEDASGVADIIDFSENHALATASLNLHEAVEQSRLLGSVLQDQRPLLGYTQALADHSRGFAAFLNKIHDTFPEQFRVAAKEYYTAFLHHSGDAKEFLANTVAKLTELSKSGQGVQASVELAAALTVLAHRVSHGKFRIRLPESVLMELYQVLKDEPGCTLTPGGAPYYLANVFAALGASNIDVVQRSKLPISAVEAAKKIPGTDAIHVFDGRELKPISVAQSEWVRDTGAHFAFDYSSKHHKELSLLLANLGHELHWPELPSNQAHHLFFVITGTSQTLGLDGVDRDALQRVSRDSDYMILSGVHYFTEPDKARKEHRILRSIAETGVPIGLFHADPKDEAAYAAFFAENRITPALSYLGMNMEELQPFLKMAHHYLPSQALEEKKMLENAMGACAAALDSHQSLGLAAQAISHAYNIPLVHLRGMQTDCIYISPQVSLSTEDFKNASALVQSAMVARIVAATKVYNSSGLPIATNNDEANVGELPAEINLISLRGFSDFIDQRASEALDPGDRIEQCVRELDLTQGYFVSREFIEHYNRQLAVETSKLLKYGGIIQAPNGGVCLHAPTVEFDIRGSTIGAGDLMDGMTMAMFFHHGILQKANEGVLKRELMFSKKQSVD